MSKTKKVMEESAKKKCSRCKVVKTKKRSFFRNKATKDGYNTICKRCVKKGIEKNKKAINVAIGRVSGVGDNLKVKSGKKNKWVEIVVNSIGGWLSDKNRRVVYDYYCEKYDEIIEWLDNNKKDGIVYLMGDEDLGIKSRGEFFDRKNWDLIDDEMERMVIVSLENYMEDLICKMIVKDIVDRDIRKVMGNINKRISVGI